MNGETVLLQEWIVMQIWATEISLFKKHERAGWGGRWEGVSGGQGHTDG